ncbi:MAG: hypothetical protein CSYNP_00331 [Syntrophus sp. SKADARSKE-3]|nr:hypothetical protein [Syntrophus sp. SKADARSKE-3]
MLKKGCLLGIFLLWALSWPACLNAQSKAQVKLCVFNFGAVNIEASGYGTTVSNMLINSLSPDATLAIMDRKELESFLNLNDLQQNDQIDNVLLIGSRLGLDVVVVGTVEKKGTVINIRCNVVQIDRKRSILRTRVSAMGDAGLMTEVRKLSDEVRKTVADNLLKQRDDEKADVKSPVNIQKRSGNNRVYLSWDPQNGKIAGYEIYRGTSEKGAYAKIAQIAKPEYMDESIERNTVYYYKIRAFDQKGLRSAFSAPLAAETALTPNPPVILSAESHVKSIALTWSPGPASDDPLKLRGYKLFRAKVEGGPYKEIANILGTDLGLGLDAALDKLLKVPYTDRGLADGEDYFYKASAYNEKGLESEFSRPLKGTAIPVVDGLAARGEMVREIELTWNHLDLPHVQGYYIYRSTSADANFLKIKKIPADSSKSRKVSYSDTEGLADKTRYYYRVTALGESDMETSASATVSAVTRGKPAAPAGLQAKSGLVKKVELTWTAGQDNDIEGYIVYWSMDKKSKFQLLKKLSGRTTDRFTDESRGSNKLDDGGTYYYIVTSYNKVDVESEPTAAVSATTKVRPAKPSGLRSEGVKVKGVVLSWTPNSEQDITAYSVYRATDGRGGNFSALAKVTGQTRFTDRDLKDGQSYWYKIQAGDKDELLSDLSDAVEATTKPKPEPPQSLNAAMAGGGVNVRWQSNSEKDIVSYTVYEKGFFKPEKIASDVKQTSYLDARPLKAGKERIYVVTATDKDGLESEFSKEMTVIGK